MLAGYVIHVLVNIPDTYIFFLQFLLEIARTKNSLPLPLLTDRSGLRLPPERYCLTGNNFKVKAPPKKVKRQQRQKISFF